MFRKFTWLACATLLCALLIALPADQVALAADVGTADAFIKAVKEGGTVTLTADITLPQTQSFVISGKIRRDRPQRIRSRARERKFKRIVYNQK